MPIEKIRKSQRIDVGEASASIHITYKNHAQVWEDFTLLRERPNSRIDYQAKPQILKLRMGDNRFSKESAETAVAAFDEETLDVLIHLLATVLHGRRVDARFFEFQMKFKDGEHEDYRFAIYFDPELYSYAQQNMGQVEEFTPYAQPWDKIVK
ncbi:hypothetical protein IHQ71_20980 [Rhizobium sp. TH2]|uniref:hypothetical protein n=1 Tax=Rhizobium sp. TH2 TaxID=2775403 RepID=UPI0021572A65|nr:hypothetical protein [Rhizobium sp. TH2]UVC07647.1 hypothetical protein IHQ71_20980 [Rhizobium sp. TH2]